MIITKRIKRKHVLFTQEQWEIVCKRADFTKMKPATYIRNMSLHKEWKNTNAEEFCLPMKLINHIRTDLKMIFGVAEDTNSEYLPRLRELNERYEEYRKSFVSYYSQLMN